MTYYTIHLAETCSAFDYETKLNVKDYKSDPKSKGSAIIVEYQGKRLTIPLDNIVCISEENR